jgi:hypothetical protein
MTRPLASYLAPYIADGDPLPDTVTVNAADLLEAVGELRRMREVLEATRGALQATLIAHDSNDPDTDADELVDRLEAIGAADVWYNGEDLQLYAVARATDALAAAAALAPADG